MSDWRDISVEVVDELGRYRQRVTVINPILALDFDEAVPKLVAIKEITAEVKQIAGLKGAQIAAEKVRQEIVNRDTPKQWFSRCHVLARLDHNGVLRFVAQRRKSKREKIKRKAARHVRVVAHRARRAADQILTQQYLSIAWFPRLNLLETSRPLGGRELTEVMAMLEAVPERTRVFKMAEYHQHVHDWRVSPPHYPIPFWLLEELIDRVEKEGEVVFVATDNPRMVLCRVDEYGEIHGMRR